MTDRDAMDILAIVDDATTALAAARLWLVGDYADRPRSEFNAEAWQALVDRVGPLLSGKPGWMHTARTYRLIEPSDDFDSFLADFIESPSDD